MAATVKRGQITTVTDTTNIRLDVSDAIDQLSPEDTPLITLVGKSSLHSPCEQVKHEWLEDELRPRSGTLAAAYSVNQGVLTLTAGEGKYLVPDDLLLVDDMVFRITSGVPSGDVVTVTLIRGTDAAAASGVAWRKIAHAASEGGDARTDVAKTVVVKPYNYTQILKDWAHISGTMAVIKRYGYVSERAYQEAKVIKQLMIDFEHNLLYGARSYEDGPPRRSSAGGLLEYVFLPGVSSAWSTVRNLAGAALVESDLQLVLREMWSLGGNPDCIMVNGYNKSRITGWATPRIRTSQSTSRGGGTITEYESDFGVLEIYKNRWLRGGDIVILTKSELGVGPLTGRQLSSRELPVTIDGTRYEVMGEYTMEVHKPTLAFGWLYNSATA